MIVTCPECSSRFKVDAEELGDNGRKVKCSICGHIWLAKPQDAQPAGEGGGDSSNMDKIQITDEDIEGDVENKEEEKETAEDEGLEPEAEAEAEAEPEAEVELETEPQADSDKQEAIDANNQGEDSKVIEEDDDEEEEGDKAAGESSKDDGLNDEEVEDIPESIKPLAAEEAGTKSGDKQNIASRSDGIRKHLTNKKFTGYAAASAIFLIILILLLATQGWMISVWPQSRAIYNLIGRGSVIPGQGLVFDRVEVVPDGHDSFKVSGMIINQTKIKTPVPMMEISLYSQYDEFIEKWYIAPPANNLEAEDTMAFEAKLAPSAGGKHTKKHIRGKALRAKIRFVLSVRNKSPDKGKNKEKEREKENIHEARTAEEGGGNTHAHQTDGQTHQSGGEAP